MTVNWHFSLLFFLLFIDSGFSDPVCSPPYTCMSTSECAGRHSARGTDEVLFHCEGRQRVCCPPLKYFSTAPSAHEITHIYTTTTETNNGEACSQCSFQQNGPQGVNTASEYPVNKGTTVEPEINQQDTGGAHHHEHAHQPSETRPLHPQPSPQPQPPEGRRPPQSEPSQPSSQSHRPQTSQTSSQTQKPHTSQIQPKPQRPQSSQQQPRPQSHRPQNSQTQNNQKQPSLTSHRNFELLPTESNCGVNNFANRITEGEEVSLGEYPWMVLTGVKDKYGNYRWNCGGTLINGWYVLTAAHCLIVDNRTIEYVRLGEHSLTNETDCYQEICLEPPEDVAIAEVIPHEKWNTTTIKNDIALLRLSRNPLKLGKSNIYPICLPINMGKLNISSSTKYEVAGWGKTDWNAYEGSEVLRKASISGVSREECNICKDKKKQQYCPLVDTQLCVQGWKSVDVCKGDSGGPLMVTRLNIYQIGITSFKGSEYCGAENIPSIFTKVESYLPWILDNIRQ